MDKDNMKEVAKIWAWKMATPKKVVGAWEFNTEESALKSPWKKISVFDLPEISGRVCLLYDDGTITKCYVEKGIMQGGYLHYDKSSDGQTDPMNMGRLLEKGDYRNGWRTGEWLSHIKLIK